MGMCVGGFKVMLTRLQLASKYLYENLTIPTDRVCLKYMVSFTEWTCIL